MYLRKEKTDIESENSNVRKLLLTNPPLNSLFVERVTNDLLKTTQRQMRGETTRRAILERETEREGVGMEKWGPCGPRLEVEALMKTTELSSRWGMPTRARLQF